MKKLLAVAISAMMVVSLAACGGSKPAATTAAPAATEPAETTTLDKGEQETGQESQVREKIVLSADPCQSLTPFGTRNSTPGNYEVYEMLYECDAFTGEMLPVLADGSKGAFNGYDHEEGSGEYLVYIYDNIHDQAGVPVKASDIAFSYMYAFNNEEVSGWNDLQNVEAVDDTTVKFTFAKEQNNVGQLENFFARCFIVSEESFNKSESKFATEMCGTGPYKLVSYTSGAEIVIEADENYWNKGTTRQESQQNVKTIVYELIAEASQKVNGLNTGKLDMAQDMSAEAAKDYADGGQYADKFSVNTIQNKFVYNTTCNNSPESLCSDINLRLAIFNSIDNDGLVLALGGVATPLPSYACSYYSDYDFVDWAAMDNYNTKKAVDPAVVKDYLSKSNYNGETLTLITSGDPQAATIVAAQLAAQGIKAEVKALDRSSYQSTQREAGGWDIDFGTMAGDYNVTVWQHGFSYHNTGDGDHTAQFIVDQAWEDLLNLNLTIAGHTPENMKAWWQHAVDNAYCMGNYADALNTVIPEDMTQLYFGDKLTPLPGACTYAAQ